MGLYPNSNFIERSNGDYTIEAARHMSGKFMVTLYKRCSTVSTGRLIQSMKSFDHLHDAMNYTIQVVRNPHQYIWQIVQRLERYHSMLSERDRDTGEVSSVLSVGDPEDWDDIDAWQFIFNKVIALRSELPF